MFLSKKPSGKKELVCIFYIEEKETQSRINVDLKFDLRK